MNTRCAHVGTLLAMVIALLHPCAGFAQTAPPDPKATCTQTYLKSTVQVGGYTFKTYGADEGRYAYRSCLQVSAGNAVVLEKIASGHMAYTLGQAGDGARKIPALPNGADITGRGNPDMIVSYYSGGMHCCLSHYVFELQPRLRLLATINGRGMNASYFADLEGNGHYYYVGRDYAFDYFTGSSASSPAPVVILRWVETPAGGGFHLALDKMHRPGPTVTQWNDNLALIRQEWAAGQSADGSPTLWRNVADLIYTGHADLAWALLDQAGPAAHDTRKDHADLPDFCARLKASDYWSDLAPTLKNAPPACLNATLQNARRGR